MKAFWSFAGNGHNFGDQLTPWLFEQICGVTLFNSQQPEIVACGSIAELISEGYSGYILGTGMIYAKTRKDFSKAKVLALRGALTQAACSGVPEGITLGDFGLALRHVVPKAVPKYDIGEIPHHVTSDSGRNLGTGGQVIRITLPPADIIDRASQCRRIVSNSLHALVLADVLGIENKWIPDKEVLGDGHKFRDYVSAFGEEIKPNEWRLAPQDKVDKIANQLVSHMWDIVSSQ
jgi:pyruvyltransferase